MPSLYSQLCRRIVLPVGDGLTGLSVMRHLGFYERSQYWPLERLHAERDRLLRETVAVAYAEVPFYRALYDSHGVSPSDLRGVEDLPKLPVVNKAMLRAAFPDGCTRRTGLHWHDYTTSGSTGNPFVVRVDDDTMSRARALMFLRTMYAGWQPGDRTLQFGMTMERGRLKGAKDKVLRTTYASAWDLSDAVVDRLLETIDRRKLEFVTGYASAVYVLARRARAVGFNRPLRGVVSWATNLLPQYREEIKRAFGCQTFDSYGVGEGMQVASECPNGRLHVFALHVVCEVADNAAHPVPAGTRGDILLTRLDPGAMPLIRYSVGDVGRASAGVPCPCGRTLPQLEALDGRPGDLIVTPGGKILTLEFFFAIFQQAGPIETFQVLQTQPDAIHVKIVPNQGFEWKYWEGMRAQILERGDPDLNITVEAVDSIPRETGGKPRYVKGCLSAAPSADASSSPADSHR